MSNDRHIHTAALDQACLYCRDRDARVAKLEMLVSRLREAILAEHRGHGYEECATCTLLRETDASLAPKGDRPPLYVDELIQMGEEMDEDPWSEREK